MAKYKQLVEKKIQEIVEKLNRGISSTAILKEIANSADIAKKIEVNQQSFLFLSVEAVRWFVWNELQNQTETLNKASMETFECCSLLKNYLLDAKKNLIENAKKEECIQRIQQGDNLTDFKEVFTIVLKNVEVK